MALRHGALKLDKSFGSATCPWRISSADDLMLTQKQNIILNNNKQQLWKSALVRHMELRALLVCWHRTICQARPVQVLLQVLAYLSAVVMVSCKAHGSLCSDAPYSL
jgi:hypothetical protein